MMRTGLIVALLSAVCAWSGVACEPADGTRENRPSTDDGDNGTDESGSDENGSGTTSEDDPSSDTPSSTDKDPPTGAGCSGMDILFVVDDSGSMYEEQENLANEFPKFIDVLEAYKTKQGTQLDYRVGVTTTGITRNFKERIPLLNWTVPTQTQGPDGVLQGQAACGLSEPWLDGPGPEVTDRFSCMAEVGTQGSATEMPFAAIEMALVDQAESGKPNEGFYRKDEDSLLVIVVITDEDDCSIDQGGLMVTSALGESDCSETKSKGLYTVDYIKGVVDEVTGGEGRYVVIGIAGPGPSSCTSDFGNAANAKRLRAFIDACGQYGVFGDICAGDLWTSLEKGLEVMQVSCDAFPPVL